MTLIEIKLQMQWYNDIWRITIEVNLNMFKTLKIHENIFKYTISTKANGVTSSWPLNRT